MSKPKISIFKKIISNKYLFFLLFFFLLLALIYLVKAINYRRLLSEELDYFEEQVEGIETENQNLVDNLEKSKTEYFKEKAARLNMGLQKPGERVIVIVPLETDCSPDKIQPSSPKSSLNFKTWWNYFFKKSNH